jgi:hypothetical protein
VSSRPASQPTLLRKVLLTLMIIGSTGGTLSAGTFASYTARTANSSASFETGSLVLSNITPVTNTLCYSAGGGPGTTFSNGNSKACDGIFTLSNQTPSATVSTQRVTLKNEGDLNATLLQLSSSGACANADTGSGYHGGGDLCSALRISIQEYTTSGFTTKTAACVYPASTSAACNTTPAGVISTFTSTYAASPLNVGTAGSATSGMNTGTSRYFIISIQLPTTITDQTIQGRAATFAFSWQLAQ